MLTHRALVAEATLQAVMKLPQNQLQEKGFFDFVFNAVKTTASVAMKVHLPASKYELATTLSDLLSTSQQDIEYLTDQSSNTKT